MYTDRTLDRHVVLPPSTGNEYKRGWYEPERWCLAVE